MMKGKRNGSIKNSCSKKKEHLNGYEQFLIAKRRILAGDTRCVIKILEDLLTTNFRLSAAFELCYYYFQSKNIDAFDYYYDLLKNEEKDQNILNKIKQMKLYLKVNVLNEKINRQLYSYYESQIILYDKEDLFNHLKIRRFSKEKELQENKFLYFWNPYELVEKIEENLHANFKNSEYDVYDYYYMRIEKNGIVNNKIVSTVEIMTIKNTMNIIDLNPSDKEKHRRLLNPISPIKLTMQD